MVRINPHTIAWPSPAERAQETKTVQWQIRNCHWAHRRLFDRVPEGKHLILQPIDIVSDRIWKTPHLRYNVNVMRVWGEEAVVNLWARSGLEKYMMKLPLEQRLAITAALHNPDIADRDNEPQKFFAASVMTMVQGSPMHRLAARKWVTLKRPRRHRLPENLLDAILD